MLIPLAYLIVYMYKLVNSLMVIIVPHPIIWSWYTGHWRVAYDEGTGHAGPQPAQSLIAVPNVTAHPSTASVPITVLLYNGPLHWGFNMLFKGWIKIFNFYVSETQYTTVFHYKHDSRKKPTTIPYSIVRTWMVAVGTPSPRSDFAARRMW